MKVVVLDDYQDAFRRSADFAGLADHEVAVFTDAEPDPVRLAARVADADALVLIQQRSRLPRAAIERFDRVRFISQTGKNIAHLDLDACRERGIVVSTGGGTGPHATAELTWGLVLAASRHIPFEVAALKAGRWQSTIGRGLRERTLGIYAYGKIGSVVAGYGRAFGMRVVCHGREGSLARAAAAGYEITRDRQAFFAESDVLCLHLPLGPETRGIVTAQDLAAMRTDALFVNTSRGPLVATGALAAALRAGRPGWAAIDVFDHEPATPENEALIGLPNALCTPHLGYVEESGYVAIFRVAIDQLVAFAAGRPVNVVT